MLAARFMIGTQWCTDKELQFRKIILMRLVQHIRSLRWPSFCLISSQPIMFAFLGSLILSRGAFVSAIAQPQTYANATPALTGEDKQFSQ
ncbi:hypothetical protein K458DRAFT_114103 [Lentithecium fluviatile CBS 122367]|uniref:Uncharacterized protein n=1 Tax=Lentithecium fluviatile CBS 122367 TaxID=1168545 RepID=A0A6G1INJ8_9PLEO|nr:hypothetical protein K458DRAFT_114103 [Lentithecium fluviatile CBS 122367]